MQKRIEKATNIFRHNRFLQMTQEQKESAIKYLLARGLTLEELALAQEAAYINFNILDKGVLSKILFNLSPRDVIATCATNRKYAHVCREPHLFERLLRAHYPQDFETDNPRQQYLALTYDIKTLYAFPIDFGRQGIDAYQGELVQLTNPSLIEFTPNWSLYNVGLYSLSILIRYPLFAVRIEQNLVLEKRDPILWFLFLENLKEAVKQSEDYVDKGKSRIQMKEKFPDEFAFLDRVFRKLAAEFRKVGAEGIIKDPAVRRALDEYYETKLNTGNSIEQLRAGEVKRLQENILEYVKDGKSRDLRHSEDREILAVRGNAPPAGITAWIAVEGEEGAPQLVHLRKRREDLVEFLLDHSYGYLLDGMHGKFYDYLEGIGGGVDAGEGNFIASPEFAEFLKANPETAEIESFTREGLRDYMMTHDIFQLPDENQWFYYYFRQVTFP